MLTPSSFSFFSSYFDAGADLPYDVRCVFFEAIISYVFTGEEPNIDGVARAMFRLAKPNLDVSRKRSLARQASQSEEQEEEQADDQTDIKRETNENQTAIKSKSKPTSCPPKDSESDSESESGERNPEEETEREGEHEGEASPAGEPLFASDDTNVTALEAAPTAASALKRKERASPQAALETTGFYQFWAAYPRKENKPSAERAWLKIMPRADPVLFQAIMDAIDRWRQTDQWQESGGKYIPHPATFINARRWEDDIPSTAIYGLHSPPRERSNIQGYLDIIEREEREVAVIDVERGCPDTGYY